MEDLGLFLVHIVISLLINECSGDRHQSAYRQPDVEAARAQERIIGVCVGVGLAMMFLIVLCISYNYYRNKPSVRLASDAVAEDVEIPKPKKQEFKSNIHAEKRNVESATQDTRF